MRRQSLGKDGVVALREDTSRTSHTASTSMYSLTFRVCVTTPPKYRRNGMAHTVGVSILSTVRGVFAGMRSVCVRHACRGPGGLPLGSATHFHSVAIATQPVHRLQIRPTRVIPYHSPSYIPVHAIGWACGHGQTQRQTHRRAWPQYIPPGLRLTRNVIMCVKGDMQRFFTKLTKK